MSKNTPHEARMLEQKPPIYKALSADISTTSLNEYSNKYM